MFLKDCHGVGGGKGRLVRGIGLLGNVGKDILALGNGRLHSLGQLQLLVSRGRQVRQGAPLVRGERALLLLLLLLLFNAKEKS